MNIGINTQLLFHKDFIKVTSEYRTAIMGLSMLSIMLFHQYFTSTIPFNVFHSLGYWGVDIFLFLSGIGLVNSLNKNSTKEYYKRRFIRIIPSCILCGTTKYLLFTLFYSSLFILKDGLNIGIWSIASLDLWFIHTIIILYIISPLLHWILEKWPYETIIIIIIIFFINGFTLRPEVGFEWMSPKGVTSWTLERLPVFTAGMLVSMNKFRLEKYTFLSASFLMAALCLNYISKTKLSIYCDQTYQIFALLLGMPALLTICISLLKVIPNYIKIILSFLGTYSLELYLVHEFIFWAMKIVFTNANTLLLLVSSFSLSCLVAYTCKKSINIIFHH